MAEMITGVRTRIELPAPEPLAGGVLSVARVIDASPHELLGVEAESDACATVDEWTEWCTLSPTVQKVFEAGPMIVAGDPFALYAGVGCDLQRLSDAEARARRRLDYGESRGVDIHVHTLLQQLVTERGVDLEGDTSIVQAIGLLENYAASIYGGVPTILIPRQLLPCAAHGGVVQFGLNGSLTTASGSPVAAYLDIAAINAGDPPKIFATGQITLLRGPVNSYSVPQQVFADGSFAPMRALAERVYVPLIDCLVISVSDVTCTYCCPSPA